MLFIGSIFITQITAKLDPNFLYKEFGNACIGSSLYRLRNDRTEPILQAD